MRAVFAHRFLDRFGSLMALRPQAAMRMADQMTIASSSTDGRENLELRRAADVITQLAWLEGFDHAVLLRHAPDPFVAWPLRRMHDCRECDEPHPGLRRWPSADGMATIVQRRPEHT
jgi:hypothetical protein